MLAPGPLRYPCPLLTLLATACSHCHPLGTQGRLFTLKDLILSARKPRIERSSIEG